MQGGNTGEIIWCGYADSQKVLNESVWEIRLSRNKDVPFPQVILWNQMRSVIPSKAVEINV